MSDELALRQALPADLVTLLAEFPRMQWERDPAFGGLPAFWLDRHLAFRRLLASLSAEAERMADRNSDAQKWKAHLSRLGSHLLQDLTGHHQIEDHAYFPRMVALEPAMARGFALLDHDHHALDHLLNGFVTAANRALTAEDAAAEAGRLRDFLTGFDHQLVRHLEDEEDLIIPVVLKHRMG